MRIQHALLAAAAVLTLAAPVAAFAEPHDGGYPDSYAQTWQDSRGQDGAYHRQDYREHARWGDTTCRRGVFYMRGSYCSTHRDRYWGHDERRGYEGYRYGERPDDNRGWR